LKEKINECLKLQDKLNKKIDTNWKNIRTREDFFRAIWLECAESVESLPWKWWKKIEPDIQNLEIELADIFHFVLSLVLMERNPDLSYFYKGLNKDFSDLKDIEGDYINHYLALKYKEENTKIYIYLIERIAEKALKQDLNGVLFFFGIVVSEVFNFDKLYLLYIGKNILNHIRQEKGYKSGNYQKVIGGLEDNKYLLKVIKEVNSKDELEEKLRNVFNSLLVKINMSKKA